MGVRSLELSKNKQYHRLLKEVEGRIFSSMDRFFIDPFLAEIRGLHNVKLVV